MKNILLFLTLFFLAADSFGQRLKDTSRTKEYFLAMSKRNRNTAWILLGTGTTIAIAGLYITSADLVSPNGYLDTKDLIGPLIGLTGGVIMLVSIPYFIDAKLYRKRATSITMGHQRIQLPVTGNYPIPAQATITLRIGL
jgi:hypothetical protein